MFLSSSNSLQFISPNLSLATIPPGASSQHKLDGYVDFGNQPYMPLDTNMQPYSSNVKVLLGDMDLNSNT